MLPSLDIGTGRNDALVYLPPVGVDGPGRLLLPQCGNSPSPLIDPKHHRIGNVGFLEKRLTIP